MNNFNTIAEQQTRIIAQQAISATKISSMEDKVDAMHACLIGNGKPGLIIRLDRVEQRHKVVSKLVWAVVVAVVGLSVSAFWS